ncbi:ABC transporter ATP-binding protein [Hydromonas duriensis]|uniref:ABC-2 type transport system ATP-binding protein n=1 Tax=Hydromonas duriensis TaxID=1527608 RepID=A0A4V3DJT1_9BURK|nr:ABC transporter ATP-binding protein [Hydromonas duriensis]TDR31355.1 ABC-2 type transport system ATP-binding protein [Hydromonas duriensis]
MNAVQPAIEVNRVVKRYGDLTALNDVSFTVRQGEFFGLLGPNGAGKTTLISSMAGLVRPSAGSVKIMGCDAHQDYQNARRQLGVVPQELAFDPFFTVRDTLRWQSGYFGLKNNDAWIDELLHHLGLSDKANANMRQLSGGMKRRVLVAQALVHRPPVMILDEPTAGVDVELRQTLWQFVSRLHKEGHTIVLTTHYLEEAEQLCERIAMLKKGELIALDRTSALLQQLAGVQLSIKLHNTIHPQALSEQVRQTCAQASEVQPQDKLSFTLKKANEVEAVLTAVRLAGGELEDVKVSQADLEEVFVRMMQTDARVQEVLS